MFAILIPFLTALVVSLLLVPVARAVSFRLGCVAIPKSARWNRRPTALLGGVAIVLAVFCVVRD